jgi:CBS domain containing-hemolysin-like protein
MSDDSSNSGRWLSGLKTLLFGDRENSLRDQIEDAIDDAEEESGAFSKSDLSLVERQMLRNLLHFGERTVGDVAVPRSDIIAVEEAISFKALVAAFADAEHSRLPVYRDSLDTVIGMVHIKDVFEILATGKKEPANISVLIREPLYVPPSMGVLDLLADMRSKRMHLAIVIDEYSGTEGLITIEDLVEEIVGDIEDEHDDAPVAMLVSLGDGNWDADARTPIEDVARDVDERLGVIDEDIDTLGGLAFVLAGHVPHIGEILSHESGWKIEVLQADTRRVTRVRLHMPTPENAKQEQKS